jgi:pyruvate dehydrogenase E1 component
MAVIVDRGIREMVVEQLDVFYYVTLMNENYAQPDLPSGAEEGVIRGAYRFARRGSGAPLLTLMGSGAILPEVVLAAEQLASEGIASEVISVTSWSELARDAQAKGPADAYLTLLFAGASGPIIAASDYVRAVPEGIRAYVPRDRHYVTLGTDGFGRSDTRAALREHFGIDAASIAGAARAAAVRASGAHSSAPKRDATTPAL